MARPYTSGLWRVKPGREDEFVAAWTAFARWSTENVPGAEKATLLRDLGEPNVFLTFGPWASLEAIEDWRALPEWQDNVNRIRGLLEDFQPRTLELVAQIP